MYGSSTHLKMPFNAALEKVAEALKAEGLGVLTDIDVRAALKAKVNIAHRSYRIPGACNPPPAHRTIKAGPGQRRRSAALAAEGFFERQDIMLSEHK